MRLSLKLAATFASLLSASLPMMGDSKNSHPSRSTSAPFKDGTLAKDFQAPPQSARPWVYWFWINGNISKEGITADLESFKKAGIGGLIWMEVSGPWWAPDGKVVALSPEWHDCMQWALKECDRLGIEFAATLDFGYGSGGPHITPDLSMQRLVWSEKEIEGGRPVSLTLERPFFEKKMPAWLTPGAQAWLRPGAKISPEVLGDIERIDSFRDVAVLAIPLPASQAARDYRIPALDARAGLHWSLPSGKAAAFNAPAEAIAPADQVIDLTHHMDKDGRLNWDAPAGKWLILRCGHASNFKMTRPSPQAAIGLEADRLSRAGIDAHYEGFLQKIIRDAGTMTGGTLSYFHIDSWEAGGQNWTATFPEEFRRRRGYDLRKWLPVLAGRMVGSEELTQRFLWDVRMTVSELIRDNYALRLRELAQSHGMKLSLEPYGHLNIDNLSYGGVSDLPISEFWAMGEGAFPTLPRDAYTRSSKAVASAAHTYGKPVVGAEAYTSGRGWQDHPYLLKGMGDTVFTHGVNRLILHLAAHQPYPDVIPGLTHRRWGEHFQRYNTWWNYSQPWMDYLSRSQHLLQQGQFVADVCYWFGEGAPISVNEMTLNLPAGYDFDFCSSEVVLTMDVRDGRIVLPSGMSYRYLLLPPNDRMSLPHLLKIRELVEKGAVVIGGQRPKGSPGLNGYPDVDAQIAKLAAELWDTSRLRPATDLAALFKADGLAPDFEGTGLNFIHRQLGDTEIYFISNAQEQPNTVSCVFRVSGKVPELWNPETGSIRTLSAFTETNGRTTVPLQFGPMQSWFVVFRPKETSTPIQRGNNFSAPHALREIAGSWEVTFDPKWGGPDTPVKFERLSDWSTHPDQRLRFYSGTAVYKKTIELSADDIQTRNGRLTLDLGQVAVMARVQVNGMDCGIAWKPPYRVDISTAARPGHNSVEIHVVNLWINRMIGDEHLPEDSKWIDAETLAEWPEWFQNGSKRTSGRYTFTTAKHYKKESPLSSSGLLGPVKLQKLEFPD